MGRKMRGCDGMSSTWYFCRTCAHRGLFVAKPDEPVRCPRCHERHVESIMKRRDVEWTKRTQVDGDVGKEVRGNG
jgi:DNA-directed RNA polymerase subunit RPC12/RpoP